MLKFKGGLGETGRKGQIPRVGDLIMLHDVDPRIKPKRALVLSLIKSEDGQIRKCKVKIGTRESVRPISSLRDLEFNVLDQCPGLPIISDETPDTVQSADVTPKAPSVILESGARSLRPSRVCKDKVLINIRKLCDQDLI